MPEITWIKIATDMFEDEKLLIIESMPECDAVLVMWTKLLLRAGRCNAGGWIYMGEDRPYTDEMLAAIFRRPLNTVRLALGTLEKLGMIEVSDRGIYVSSFEKYQNTATLQKIREQTKLRMQTYRSNLKLKESVTVTHRYADVTQEKENREGEEEKEREENTSGRSTPIDCCFSFSDYRNLESVSENKVGFLVSAFKRLHPDAPQEDFDGCGGRIAAIWKRKSHDTGYILGVIWDTAARSINGSHLNYIQKFCMDNSRMTADQVREYVRAKNPDKLPYGVIHK